MSSINKQHILILTMSFLLASVMPVMARRSIQGKILAPTFAQITNKRVPNRSISAFVLNQRHKQCNLSPTFLKQPLYVSNKPGDTSSSFGAAYHASANQQIVARRNEINRQKRQARQKALDKDRERNLKLRNLFMEEKQNDSSSSSSHDSSSIPPMFAVKVVTCRTLRLELRMNGREKRGRMFVERPSIFSAMQNEGGEGEVEQRDDDASDDNEYACMSLKALKQTIHEFFRRLKKSTYILSASLPILDEDGNVLTSEEGDDDDQNINDNNSSLGMRRLETDEDVQNAFLQAEQFYQRHQEENESTSMKRPTLVIHVTKDPDAPPPPPPPPYLVGMPDPLTSPTMTMLSFYAFPPDEGISDPESTADQLKRLWRPFRALGRVYVAKEGVNAQMSVPTNVLSNFLQCCTVKPEEGGELSHVLGTYMENGINIDPIAVDMEEFQAKPAFKNLHIRVRSQIVADGFATPLDWQSAGYDMPPLEWHQKLKEAREANEKGVDNAPLPIVLDCRNDYETQVGKFELAEPLDTENFRDSWDVLKGRLKDVPKDAPVMTYCTGGIRCVKVNAYLTQEMGMTNVSRLAGGIISYDRTLNEQAPAEESMFKGVNYVFDSRMGRRITDDQLGTCYTCGSKTHLVSNCKNENCHRRMVQCENCVDSLLGTCSEGCKGRVVNAGMVPKRKGEATNNDVDETRQESDEVYTNVDDYSSGYSSSSPSLFRQIELNTAALLPSGAHMVSGAMQGSLLKMLASQTSGRVLEIGSFTGYATACFLEGAAIAGELGERKEAGIGGREGGPFVLSLERDRRALGIASAHIKAMSELGLDEDAAEEASKLADGPIVDFEGDSVSFTYKGIAGCEFLRVNDALATVEEMASSQSQLAPFDIAFVDADKTRLMDYVDALASNDRLLKKGGLIIVDNVLWKGLVLDANNNGYDSSDETSPTGSNEEKALLKKNRRARKLAMKMHQFNSEVVRDERVEVVMMPIRDGLSLIRKR
mmetsp:Transcript_17800/g.35697  ORF Transcript_17800/g.35697 Transcript_17800/m.35697 type:complete len:989 (-) Transcript_17800:127-3093(-)